MRYAFIKAQEVAFPVNVMCRLLEVSRSGYYAWKERPEAPLDAAKVAVAAEVEAAHRRSRGTYGSPRIHRDLRARGVRISRKRVERLMREKGLKGAQKRRFRCTTDSRHTLPIAPNELDRNFDPSQPDRVWAGVSKIGSMDRAWIGQTDPVIAIARDSR